MNNEIKDLFKFLILQSTIASNTPMEILHKYLIRNKNYEEFIGIVNESLPNDMFGDDDWIKEFVKTIKNKEHKKKFEELTGNFNALRTFMRDNKMYDQMICGYPDPDMDSKIVERLISGNVNSDKDN